MEKGNNVPVPGPAGGVRAVRVPYVVDLDRFTARCSCGFTEMRDEEIGDHLLEVGVRTRLSWPAPAAARPGTFRPDEAPGQLR